MKALYRNLIIAVLMFAATGIAVALRPTQLMADIGTPLDLEEIVPQTFGDWQELRQSGQIVNPQLQQTLDKFYAQVLSRMYVNSKGEGIMLSIAYGKDQSDEKQVHYPEVCYPAQGFHVLSTQKGSTKTDFGDIRVKRLLTELGVRKEPITYWTTVGERVVLSGYEAKKAQLSYGFNGYVPDGLIFRVSSVDNDSEKAFKLQQTFISDLIKNISPSDRLRLAGINSKN